VAKFVVTSDWHIGARMGSAGRAATRFREIRFETAGRVVRLVGEREAGALFLLGDTFDGDGVGSGDLDRTLSILRGASCPVYVLPGNHDWWHPGGVLAAFSRAAEAAENVHVLTEIGVPLVLLEVPGVTFYPCPVRKHADVTDPTRWIPPRREEDGARVALIHGALDQADWGGRVPERVAEERDLDLALLGDWHKPVSGPDGRTFYAGSLEPGGFDEEHRGQVLVAGVPGKGVPEKGADEKGAGVERVPVGRLAWRRIELELLGEAVGGIGPAALEAALAAIDTEIADIGKEDTAVRLRLTGKLSLAELDRLDAILSAGREAGFAEFDENSEVEPLGDPDLDAFEEETLKAVARRMWEGDEPPEVRRRALAILATLAEETR